MTKTELRRVYSNLAKGAETPAPEPAVPTDTALLRQLLEEQRRTNELIYTRKRKPTSALGFILFVIFGIPLLIFAAMLIVGGVQYLLRHGT